jgi:hypothetical protein
MNERILARQDEEKMGKLYTYRREEASVQYNRRVMKQREIEH